ncbi:hypothetical protein SAMN04488038_101268 [Solimonas aquatica]|uniref:Enoyl reductase (ER) domain-containing protein n=2 Tax=Solimonas aquatica TaxID=489703 RepID=A0A1H9A4N6_9GAMM|nr:hypothetical protein SAMN04488038_101268 [Solimonas aquatica]
MGVCQEVNINFTWMKNMNDVNRRIVLDERPRYIIPTANCFRVVTEPKPRAGKGEMLLRNLWLSMDPYLLSKVKRFSQQGEPLALGETMNGLAVAQVLSSDNPDFAAGDMVMGLLPWADYVATDGRRAVKLKVQLPRLASVPGALGYAGFTAYLAVMVTGKAQQGETVVIGSANSGLAQIAAQLAKRQGARVVGISLGEHQCSVPPAQLGFDAYIDSRSETFAEQLRASCPRGVDLYIELVGGDVLDKVLPLLNLRARVVVAGLKALYTAPGLPEGPDRTMLFLNEVMVKRLQVLGLVNFDHVKEHYSEFKKAMVAWINAGEIQVVENVVDGLENAPRALQTMFESNAYGHVVVRADA